jgi:GT2 family glycosyltransferase
MDRRLSVSLVLYRTDPADISACLASLALHDTEMRIFVIDNSPIDVLRTCFTGANTHYQHNPANPGFGAAHNLALALSAQEGFQYHLVLNADVRFDAEVLTPMLDYLDANAGIGQMMPMVRNPDGSIQRLCKLVPTPADLLFRRFLPSRLKVKSNRRFELHDSGYDRIMSVPYLSGCFMLLRNSALAEVGVFDERFFMYPEDIDLTRRMAEKYDTVFFPGVSVFHTHGAASRSSLKMLFIHATNMFRYFNKWGWIFDPSRVALNARTLAQLSARQTSRPDENSPDEH